MSDLQFHWRTPMGIQVKTEGTEEELVERLAIALCRAYGDDPYMCVTADGFPLFKRHEPEASRFLAMMKALQDG